MSLCIRLIRKICSSEECLCLFERVDLTHIEQSEVFLLPSDECPLVAVLQVEVNDAETLGHRFQKGEDGWPQDMYTTESQPLALRRVKSLIGTAHLARIDVGPTVENHLIVEEQIALGGATAHQQECIGRTLGIVLVCEIEIAQYVDIMYQDGTLGVEERQCLPDATTRLEQSGGLIADTDVESEIAVLMQVVDNLLRKVVHIDDDALITSSLELMDDMPKKRLSPHPDECLGHRVGQGLEARPESGCEYHSLFHGHKITQKREKKQIKRYFLIPFYK